jgi:hypothetical protein
MTKQDVINGYMINEKHVIAEMLYDTITKYEQQNKAFVDMVEMQSKKIKEVEKPKTCDGCEYQHKQDDDCFRCARYHDDRYEPKQ